MKLPSIRSIGTLTAIVATSIVVPSAFSSLEHALTPHFDPVAFGLPSTAQEVVSKRTEKAVTFEVSPGKFASVSAGEHLELPSCDRATLSMLCRAVSLVRGIIPNAFAVSQGPNSPGTMATDLSFGQVSWLNASNASTSNDAYASFTGADEVSTYLKATNFGFSLPTGANIDGITTEVERYADQPLSSTVTDSRVRLVKGGTIGSTNRGAFAT